MLCYITVRPGKRGTHARRTRSLSLSPSHPRPYAPQPKYFSIKNAHPRTPPVCQHPRREGAPCTESLPCLQPRKVSVHSRPGHHLLRVRMQCEVLERGAVHGWRDEAGSSCWSRRGNVPGAGRRAQNPVLLMAGTIRIPLFSTTYGRLPWAGTSGPWIICRCSAPGATGSRPPGIWGRL
jgi:hypothetical protein